MDGEGLFLEDKPLELPDPAGEGALLFDAGGATAHDLRAEYGIGVAIWGAPDAAADAGVGWIVGRGRRGGRGEGKGRIVARVDECGAGAVGLVLLLLRRVGVAAQRSLGGWAGRRQRRRGDGVVGHRQRWRSDGSNGGRVAEMGSSGGAVGRRRRARRRVSNRWRRADWRRRRRCTQPETQFRRQPLLTWWLLFGATDRIYPGLPPLLPRKHRLSA